MPATARAPTAIRLKARPVESMDKILRLAGVACAADSISTVFEAAHQNEVEGVDQELRAETLSLYERMRDS